MLSWTEERLGTRGRIRKREESFFLTGAGERIGQLRFLVNNNLN